MSSPDDRLLYTSIAQIVIVFSVFFYSKKEKIIEWYKLMAKRNQYDDFNVDLLDFL